MSAPTNVYCLEDMSEEILTDTCREHKYNLLKFITSDYLKDQPINEVGIYYVVPEGGTELKALILMGTPPEVRAVYSLTGFKGTLDEFLDSLEQLEAWN